MAAVKTKRVKPVTAVEPNQYRLHLQGEMKKADQVRDEHQRAGEALRNAEILVQQGEKPPLYSQKFVAEVRRLSARLSEISDIPRILLNSCQDETLRSAYEVAKEIRAAVTREYQTAQSGVADADLERIRITDRIRGSAGAGAIVEDGDRWPWESGRETAWARRGDELAFNPKQNQLHESNVKAFLDMWSRATQSVKVAKARLAAVSQRSDEADEALNEARAAMINSPI